MICDECETVAHCMKNGCVPKTNVQQEPVAYIQIPVAYQYCYPDGTWRCSFGNEINGQRPIASRALYARKDGK